jgi:periplasmic protein TonB
MELTLISTGAKTGRSRKGLAFSIALHSALIIAAAAGTTHAINEADKPAEEKLTYITPAKEPPPKKVFVAPKAPPPPPAAKQPQAPRVQLQAPPRQQAAAPKPAAPAPAMPNVPVMPVAPVAVPSSLPKIDIDATAMLGDVVRRAGDEIAASSKAGVGSGAPASSGTGSGERVVTENFGNTAFDDSQVDKVVVPITNANPEYPSRLRSAGVTGSVQVRFIVDANGKVEPSSIKIVSTPHPDFVDGVKRALRNARFRPAEKNGTKVRQLVEQSFVFQLQG